MAAAGEALGGIDVLVNNASGFGMGDDEAGWAAGLAVDVMAMVRASHAALPLLAAGPRRVDHPHLVDRRPARIDAHAGLCGGEGRDDQLHRRARPRCWRRKRIRVNCIAPGSIEFPGGVWDQRKKANDPLYDRVFKSIPFGRLGTPEEIAEVALFLASPHARWVTGQTIAVDGGQLLAA